MTIDPLAPGDLSVRGRRWVRWLWVPLLAVIVGVAWWWALHPEDLPRSDLVVEETVKAGQTLYVGVPAGDVPGRKLTLHDVKITASATPDADVTTSAWVCRGGSFSRTTTPEAFCQDWSEADDATLRMADGDQLVLAIRASSATVVDVTSIEVDFTDGLQRGTSDFGPRFRITFLG